MIAQELLDYIKKELDKGFSYDQIQAMLLEYNYSQQMIAEAFVVLQQQNVQNVGTAGQQQQSQLSSQPLSQSSVQQSQQPEQSSLESGQQQEQQPLQQQTQQQPQQQVSAKPGELTKLQKVANHYLYVLSGLVAAIALFQVVQAFSVPNLIKTVVFLFVAAMTVMYAKQRFVQQKFLLLFRIFLVLDILVLIGLVIGLFAAG